MTVSDTPKELQPDEQASVARAGPDNRAFVFGVLGAKEPERVA